MTFALFCPIWLRMQMQHGAKTATEITTTITKNGHACLGEARRCLPRNPSGRSLVFSGDFDLDLED